MKRIRSVGSHRNVREDKFCLYSHFVGHKSCMNFVCGLIIVFCTRRWRRFYRQITDNTDLSAMFVFPSKHYNLSLCVKKSFKLPFSKPISIEFLLYKSTKCICGWGLHFSKKKRKIDWHPTRSLPLCLLLILLDALLVILYII